MKAPENKTYEYVNVSDRGLWILDKTYPYAFRDILDVAYLFNDEFTRDEYDLMEEYFGNDHSVYSKKNQVFLKTWEKYYNCLLKKKDAIKKLHWVGCSLEQLWIPGLRDILELAKNNNYVVWTSMSLVAITQLKKMVFYSDINRNLPTHLRASAITEIEHYIIKSNSYFDCFLKTYNVIMATLNNNSRDLEFRLQ